MFLPLKTFRSCILARAFFAFRLLEEFDGELCASGLFLEQKWVNNIGFLQQFRFPKEKSNEKHDHYRNVVSGDRSGDTSLRSKQTLTCPNFIGEPDNYRWRVAGFQTGWCGRL
jgi:hypothetical protein